MSVKRLGKGLEALIRPQDEIKEDSKKKNKDSVLGVSAIPIKDIKPNPNQPRRDFNQDAIEELVHSIKAKGVVTPITVRKKDLYYEIIAGERRWRASKKAKKRTIPAYVLNVKRDSEILELSLIENIQRQDLNPLEEANAFAVLNTEFGMSHQKIAEAVGKKRTTISNSLRLLKLPPDIRRSLRKNEISSGHARAILQCKTTKQMNALWKRITQNNLSVRSAEKSLTKSKKHPFRKKVSALNKSADFRIIENELIETLGTKVKLKSSKIGGVIEISYFSDDDLERIIDLINTIKRVSFEGR